MTRDTAIGEAIHNFDRRDGEYLREALAVIVETFPVRILYGLDGFVYDETAEEFQQRLATAIRAMTN